MKQSHLLSILVCVVSLAGIVAWTAPTLPASEPDTAGIAVVAATTPCSPVRVVLHGMKGGEMGMVTVTHLKRTVTFAGSNWQHDLDLHLRNIRSEFRKAAPSYVFDFRGEFGPDVRTALHTLLKTLHRQGFNDGEERRSTGYRPPATQNF